MMLDYASQKVTADHLRRNAYLYVRQSTIRQVFENTESTKRQYALRQRAVALGWPLERIIVIDDDQGQSGSTAADRKGFQYLVAEVGMGHAGIVLGLEVSRLARNNSDWHRLLEICALTQTLILDEDGIYDPTHFNDRLLLGLKGTMSEADRLRRKQVERAQYEADLARRRFMQVDPDNRLVADSLEGEWNDKLRALAAAKEEYDRQCQKDRAVLDDGQRAKILALATDFPLLWKDPRTPDRERKRMVRLLLEDVTLIRNGDITLHVRFKGGAIRTLHRPLPLTAWQKRRTSPVVVAEIDRLLDQYTDAEIADLLNERGFRSGADQEFNFIMVGQIRRVYGLKSRYDRLRERGMLTQEEMASMLGVTVGTVKYWRRGGLLRAHAYNDKSEFLYQHPGDNPPLRWQGVKLSDPRRFASNPPQEVRCEA